MLKNPFSRLSAKRSDAERLQVCVFPDGHGGVRAVQVFQQDSDGEWKPVTGAEVTVARPSGERTITSTL